MILNSNIPIPNLIDPPLEFRRKTAIFAKESCLRLLDFDHIQDLLRGQYREVRPFLGENWWLMQDFVW